jgi:hypothetical protein
MFTHHWLASACFLVLASGSVGLASDDIARPQYPNDLTVWPNVVSKANSDPWIAENHDKIRKMNPRVLVLNFANGFSQEKAAEMANQLCRALTEGTRYHGYKDKNAPPFIEWKVVKIVDLRDPEPYPKTPDGNSTKYPRVPNWKEGINFVYSELYTDKFAEYYGIKDPDNPNKYLKLHELVDRGIIHELWFFAYQRDAGAPFECTELKPVYDENFKQVKGQYRHAGNGGDPKEPWHGRSLRISFINAERGIGCNVESLSHAIEGTAHSRVIPYFTKYFYEYAGMDLDKRYGLPFNSFYALWGEGKGIEYLDPHTAIVKDGKKQYRLENYVCIGGNVHFTPNGRGHYDLTSPATVMSTIEHYRLFDGPDGKDLAEPWTIEKFQQYRDLAPDCMGPWLIYWRQNMPGLDNKCKDDDGKPMKNWWPFLFY